MRCSTTNQTKVSLFSESVIVLRYNLHVSEFSAIMIEEGSGLPQFCSMIALPFLIKSAFNNLLYFTQKIFAAIK